MTPRNLFKCLEDAVQAVPDREWAIGIVAFIIGALLGILAQPWIQQPVDPTKPTSGIPDPGALIGGVVGGVGLIITAFVGFRGIKQQIAAAKEAEQARLNNEIKAISGALAGEFSGILRFYVEWVNKPEVREVQGLAYPFASLSVVSGLSNRFGLLPPTLARDVSAALQAASRWQWQRDYWRETGANPFQQDAACAEAMLYLPLLQSLVVRLENCAMCGSDIPGRAFCDLEKEYWNVRYQDDLAKALIAADRYLDEFKNLNSVDVPA